MSTTLFFRGKRFVYGSKPKALSNEPILPVQYPDARESRTLRSKEGFLCRVVDIALKVEDGWADPPVLCRWLGTDIKLLLQASEAGILEAAVTKGSELPLLRVKQPDKLRVMVAEYKKQIRKALIQKAKGNG